MDTMAGTTLVRGDVLPGTPLIDAATGAEVRIWDFRGRTALVLCFLHPACEACERFAAGLAEMESEFRLTGARAFAVLREPSPSALPVLVDGHGEASRRLLGPEGELPTIVVTDRYAAAWESYPVLGHDFPPVSEIVGDLWHLATICEECGIVAWQ
ncbi:MAG TPA: hypothetical protein VF097_06150 [Actinomycetota bacterium]